MSVLTVSPRWVALLLTAAALTAGVTGLEAAASAHASSDRQARPPCRVPGTTRTIDQLWHPDMRAAIAYARTRQGDIAFAVRTDRSFYGYRPYHQEWSASVVKAMLLVSYLDRASVRNRALDAGDTSVLGPMIEASDNDDAQRIFDIVGQSGLAALARRVGMTGFAPNPVWGATSVTARDQSRFFLHIDGYVVGRHRSYAMHLLRSIVPWERWGIGQLAPQGWRLYFKGGWGYATGLLDHQAAVLIRGCARVSLVVLTMYDGSHAYGKQSLEAIFARLLHRFPTRFSDHRRRTLRLDQSLDTKGKPPRRLASRRWSPGLHRSGGLGKRPGRRISCLAGSVGGECESSNADAAPWRSR